MFRHETVHASTYISRTVFKRFIMITENNGKDTKELSLKRFNWWRHIIAIIMFIRTYHDYYGVVIGRKVYEM